MSRRKRSIRHCAAGVGIGSLALLSLSGCASQSTVILETLAQSQHCPVDEAKPYWLSISSRSELPEEFQTISQSGPYWLAGIGTKPTGGYRLTIAPKATLENEQLTVNVAIEQPSGQAVTQAFTNPCLLIASSDNNFVRTLWLNDNTKQAMNVPVKPFRAPHFARHWK